MKTVHVIITILLYIITQSNSQSIVIDNIEAECLLSLGLEFDDNRYTQLTIPSYCDLYMCTSNGNILSLSLFSGSNSTLYWSNFTCFQHLEYLVLDSFSLEDDFIYNPIDSIKSLDFTKCNTINIYKELPSRLKSLSLSSPYTAKLDTSYFKYLEILSYKSTSVNGYLDLLKSSTIYVGEAITIHLASNLFPDLSSFPNLKTLMLVDTTDSFTQPNNILTYSKVVNFAFNFNKGAIPIELTQIINPQYESLSISVQQHQQHQQQPSQLLDFSNKKEKDIQRFEINFSGNYTGIFPIKKLPLVKINELSIKSANITNGLDYSIFDNATSVELFNLKITDRLPSASAFKSAALVILSFNNYFGEIDESWCYINFELYRNNLSGIPPYCISCYLGDPFVMGKVVLNSNLNIAVSCSPEKIIPNIKLDNGYVYLYGMNLGFNELNIITIPKINFEVAIGYSTLFRGQFENSSDAITYDIIDVYFRYPGYNYTLSINQSIGPNVSSVFQNNGLIIIDGAFFSYNSSDIQIIIDNNVTCRIIGSTFYQINCTLVQIDKSEVVNVTIKVKDLSTTVKSLINKVVYECSPSDCNGNGVCNIDKGVCLCDKGWLSIDSYICQIPDHYLYSNTQVLSNKGGLIELYGWYGNLHNQLNVTIGDEICTVSFVNDSLIQCLLGGGSGLKSINIIQNDLKWSGTIYPYYDPIYICPNNCGGPSKGACNVLTGECICENGFIGFDCQSRNISSNTNTSISDNGSIIVSEDYLEFLLSIDSITEYDLNLNPVLVSNFTNKWNKVNIVENSTSTTITLFSQVVNNANILLTIEEVKSQPKQFSFASNNFTISPGGFKISISIIDWNYSSSLNYLQLSLSSTLDDKQEDNNKDKDCKEQTVVESSSNSNSLQDNINYLKISKYGYSLYGRFQNKMLSNQKPTLITTKIKSMNNNNIILTIDLPHCSECILDPDFSVLVNPDSKVELCKDKKKWLLPIVIVLPVVFAALVIGSIIYLIKFKKDREFKIKLSKLGRKNSL